MKKTQQLETKTMNNTNNGHTSNQPLLSPRELLIQILDSPDREVQNPEPEHTRAVSTTNIWHARKVLEEIMASRFGEEVGRAARNEIAP